MTSLEFGLAVTIGMIAGMLSGLFGVGGGIVMTPGIQMLLSTTGIVALATPLPVILPTALTGASTYRKAGEIDTRAAAWMVLGGLPASAAGAALTEVIETPLLLVVTAALLGWQAVSLLRGVGRVEAKGRRRATPARFVLIGAAAGLVSGLLGIGGGIVMVPLMAGWLGMPLKRTLGTSLLAIVALVLPGTVVHATLGNIDWAIFVAITLGAVPGAHLGATLAIGATERTLRLLVGTFMLLVAVLYGVRQALELLEV